MLCTERSRGLSSHKSPIGPQQRAEALQEEQRVTRGKRLRRGKGKRLPAGSSPKLQAGNGPLIRPPSAEEQRSQGGGKQQQQQSQSRGAREPSRKRHAPQRAVTSAPSAVSAPSGQPQWQNEHQHQHPQRLGAQQQTPRAQQLAPTLPSSPPPPPPPSPSPQQQQQQHKQEQRRRQQKQRRQQQRQKSPKPIEAKLAKLPATLLELLTSIGVADAKALTIATEVLSSSTAAADTAEAEVIATADAALRWLLDTGLSTAQLPQAVHDYPAVLTAHPSAAWAPKVNE